MTRSRDDAQAYAQWSRLHGGMDPTTSAWVSGWVRLTHACARPLARRGVHPDAVTVAGVLLTAAVPALAALGAAWPLLATVVLVVAAVLDGVDGALAAQTGTDSAWGRVLDPLADRCSDLLLVLTLVVLGAPLWLGAAVAVGTLLLESLRATAQAAGMPGPGAVTVWERPSRVIVPAFATACWTAEWAARRTGIDVLPDVDGAVLATAFAGIALALTVVGLLHLVIAVRRTFAGG
ncbi:CDP-alcohol phosphatidyltransferase family protein [Nocardioides dongkuii]|uniref:CDP-alcohol phosphatidyltransferase family protein n=1 Tax=Nocardioides dongkuii TaxID=2760089 RepID=UPI0015F84446|nr:CDP-alcohol phosphatidyltransferase family protein [Nocardioides dongkuii]